MKLANEVSVLFFQMCSVTIPSSTLTGNVSTLGSSSPSCEQDFSTLTSELLTFPWCGLKIDLPVVMSNSQPCHGQRMISPSRAYKYSPTFEGNVVPVIFP